MNKPTITLFLICFMQFAHGQNVTSALIGHAFSDNTTIAFYFNIHTKVEVQTIPDSTISVLVSDIAQNIHIPITNFRLISQVQERIGCDSTSDTRMHQYAASVDLTDAVFSALSASCVLRGELIVSNRIGGSTSTSGNNQTIYVYDEFERCSQKLSNRNTHRTVSNGMFYSCFGQSSTHHIGAFDVAEFDSLSFELVNPMINRTTSTTYKSGLSANQPISVSASTQFSFDSAKGEFTFSPSDTTDNLASVSIKTTEWRKNNSGTYTVVGSSMREFLVFIDLCPTNTPPIIRGPIESEVCEGEQICFTVASFEHNKVPPPPLPKPKNDSVTLKWNRGIPEATFSIINPKEIHQQARFCWTTKVGDASTLPYTFIAIARDDFCPTNAIVHKSFSIYVTPTPEVELKVSRISDSSFSTRITIPTAHSTANYSVTHSLLDVIQNPFSKIDGRFKSTGSNLSRVITDTLIIKKPGKFVLDVQIANKNAPTCTAALQNTFNYHPLSVPVNAKTGLHIYPNPTTGILSLDFSLDTYEVRNNLGQIVQHGTNATKLDLQQVPNGIYIISGIRNAQAYVGRVVKF